MKKTRRLICAILLIALMVSLAGCYVVSGRDFHKLKGTYKLTRYTYTPSYERKDGYTPTTYDYVNGEKYMYEDYLIITTLYTGYYVHTDASGEAYVKEISLICEYDPEDKNDVNYVTYNDSVSVNSTEGGTHRLGVNGDQLLFSKASINYTEIITKKEKATEALSVQWEKVSNATDLSYVTEKLGELKYYDFDSFAQRGIYELASVVVSGEEASKYSYVYCVVDTAKDAFTVTAYYALAGSDEVVKKSINTSGISKDELIQTLKKTGTVSYGGYDFTVTKPSNSVTEDSVNYLIEYRTPANPAE